MREEGGPTWDDWNKGFEIRKGEYVRIIKEQVEAHPKLQPVRKVSEEQEVDFNPTSTRDKILQSVFLIVVMYAIYRFCLSLELSIWIMLFLMAHALPAFYIYFVDCHEVVYTDFWGYYSRRERKGWCRNSDKK